MDKLHAYIQAQPPRPMREWADAFGISRPYLLALLDGSRSPSVATARAIADATGGAVPVLAWANIRAVVEAVEGDKA